MKKSTKETNNQGYQLFPCIVTGNGHQIRRNKEIEMFLVIVADFNTIYVNSHVVYISSEENLKNITA